MLLAQSLKENKSINGQAYNFGPNSDQTYNVIDVSKILSEFLVGFSWKIDQENKNILYESKLLALNSSKANEQLGWFSKLSFKDTMKLTALWYQHFYSDKQGKIFDFTATQIENYSDSL